MDGCAFRAGAGRIWWLPVFSIIPLLSGRLPLVAWCRFFRHGAATAKHFSAARVQHAPASAILCPARSRAAAYVALLAVSGNKPVVRRRNATALLPSALVWRRKRWRAARPSPLVLGRVPFAKKKRADGCDATSEDVLTLRVACTGA